MSDESGIGKARLAELASKWLRIRRHFEAQAGKGVPDEARELLRELSQQQLALVARLPTEGYPERDLVSGLGINPTSADEAVGSMVEAGLIKREKDQSGQNRIRFTDEGSRARASLDRMQLATITAMFREIGPDLSRRVLAVMEGLATTAEEGTANTR